PRATLFERLPAHRTRRLETFTAFELELSDPELGRHTVELGAGARHRSLDRALIDDEQQLPGFDHLAFFEMHRFEITGDPRAHFDALLGDETPGVLVPLGDIAEDRLGD